VQHKFQRAFAPNGEIVALKSTLVFLPAGDTVAKLDKIVLNNVDSIDMMTSTFDHVHDRDGKVLYKVVTF
jgi:hypothetical protein